MEHADTIHQIVTALLQTAHQLRSLPLLQMAVHRAQGQAEPFADTYNHPPYNMVMTPEQQRLGRQFLGDELFQDYLNALRRYHPLSPDYECPEQTADGALSDATNTLGTLGALLSPENACTPPLISPPLPAEP